MKQLAVSAVALFLGSIFVDVSGYAFVARKPLRQSSMSLQRPSTSSSSRTALQMMDQNVIEGAGIAIAGLVAGIGLVAFTEAQGERARARGGGLSETMSTKLTGGLMEDVEVSSVADIGSLTSQLEQALKEAGGAKEEELAMTEADKERIAAEADDGW